VTARSDAPFWDRLARKYARMKISDPDGYERTLARTRGLLDPGDRVLELGCGTGSTALRLAGDVRMYLATDLSSGMLSIAEGKHAAEPIPSLTFRQATAESLSAEEASFDAVLAFSYLHLVSDLPDTLRRIHDLLVPGGLFISKTPCLGEMNPLIRFVMLPAMRLVGKAPHNVVSLRADELRQLIAAEGFDILACESHATNGKNIRPFIAARKGAR